MSTGKLPLRILYALNGSSQYILARSHGAVPVEFIPSPAIATEGASSSRPVTPPPPRYASASLKTCLDAICRSSPEIIQDPSRDFSVYLLDPLETDCAPAHVNISHSLSQSSFPEAPESRVAVGLGLMSWALMTDETDAIPVTGTLKVSGAGQQMLEVIFSLRQTLPMQKASLPEALRSWSEPSALSRKGKKTPAPKKPVPYQAGRRPRNPVTKADKLLAVAPIYVGPERRPQGRVPNPIESEDCDDDDVVVLDGPQRPANPGKDPSPAGTDPSRPPTYLDLLALLHVVTPELERNAVLGNVLGLVHGQDGTAIHHPPAELANAMTLLSDLQRTSQLHRSQPDNAPSHRSQPENAILSHNQHRRKSSSADDEIVFLNKENVNPKVFRRRAERAKEDPALSGPSEPSTTATSLPPPSRAPVQSQPPMLVPSDQPPKRKRTLSEFMEEQESIRDKQKALKRAHYYRQPERSMSDDSFMPPPDEWESRPLPSRSSLKRTKSCISSPGRGFFTETTIAPRPSEAASSPVRPTRPFVVPNWARTDTATKPRLSESAVQKAQQKEEEEETKRKEDRKRKYLENGEKQGAQRRRASAKPSASTSAPVSVAPQASGSTSAQGDKPKAKAVLLPAPVAASAEFPAFAKEEISRPPFAALSFGSPSRPARQNNIPPCTPPRKRRANTIATPGAPGSLFTPEGNSLFTPVGGAWEAGGVLAFGGPSMSPSSRKTPTKKTGQTEPSGEPKLEDDDILGQELESAFDDFPPSSLPIASSDVDGNTQMGEMSSSNQEDESDSDDDDAPPPKQHWVGLPPSSPPPASSPYLGPSAVDDDDIEESPLTTPGADPVSEQETLDSPDTEVPGYSMEELLNIDDLATLFPVSTTDTANIFDQFTNSNLDGDGSQPMKDMDWGLDATSPDFDFSEFWESVKPLVEGSSQPLDPSIGFEQPGETGDIDHAKLAGDVHALFSGCLV